MATMRQLSPLIWMLICAALVSLTAAGPEEQRDAREGQDIMLECRFSPQTSPSPSKDALTYYWIRTTPLMHDNVAIGNVPLQSNYRIQYSPVDGRYDLYISNTTYERDNGKFECRIKAGGSGRVVHAQSYSLVVLIPPRAPTTAPGPHVLAQEGHHTELTCSTVGGSPEPTIRWYREGSSYPMDANVTSGKSRSEPSVSSVTLMPTKDDDGAVFKCVVWNRAMEQDEQLESTIELSVNYYPRVEVGPENPYRVETDATATMTCKVDAKPKTNSVRWTRNGKFVSNSLTHTIQKVSVEDSGLYTCSADNGLGKTGEAEVFLDVLYAPTVSLQSTSYETEEGGDVEIRCDVSSNPGPESITWTKDGDATFRLNGDTLVLHRVTADVAGAYTCRAVNVIVTSSGKRFEKSGSASVAVLVRHKPGRGEISPARPVTQEGASVTLHCAVSPPGWPLAVIRWYRDSPAGSKATVLATGPSYTISSAHLGSEGQYFCQATNELGHGEATSVTLEVQQPPRFQNKLQPHLIKRARDTDFSVTCSALGKPRPNVRWLKDNAEIKPEANLYEVKTEVAESTNAVYNVQSTLKFKGNARLNTNELIPEDRGVYYCTFENEVKKVESSMHLRIEHEPIAIQQKNKVAYDLSETAEISCRILSHPKPEFQWYFGATSIQPSSNYEIDTTTDNNDVYLSVLKVKSLELKDYGDYYCKVKNTLGTVRPQIRLQPKGAPESPTNIAAVKVGPSYVTLGWDPGFDGGLVNKYFIRYRRMSGVPSESSPIGEQCASQRAGVSDWLEYDCSRMNPCNVTGLDQHDTYTFKVKAVNTKGQSNYSSEISVTTKVDMIPGPEQLTFDPSTHTVAFSVGPTCLSLVGVAEALVTGRAAGVGWQVVDTVNLALKGDTSTFQEAQIEYSLSNKAGRQTGRSFAEPSLDELNPRLRMKLCLRVSQDLCSEYTEAEIGPSYIKEASALTTPTLIAIVVSCLVFLLFLTLLFIFCRCKKNASGKEAAKEYEMDSMRPSMVSPQNQAPPPYYPSTGMENKALEHSMELALMDESKVVYGTQPQYGYHVAQPQNHNHQNISNADWANMGYMENGYANSNNGGSVNSQDSLWQMKMAAVNSGGPPATHQMLDRQSNYGYDPLAHGGYGTIDEYAPYPHLAPAPIPDQYNRTSQNPSRQEYCSDPYASVHKPKKRMDQHIESPYHEVSGLPSGYGGVEGNPGDENKGHMSLTHGYDETLESGYSTPNSRARRVIREIIV